ncbi:MAG: class I SAM-dependent methyltransferase [Dehalococcoidia bacterium]
MSSSGGRLFAALYDSLTAPLERRLLAPLRRDLLGGLSGDIIEIGAGTGANLDHVGRSARLVATEPNPAMLRRVRVRRARLAKTNVALVQAAAEALPASDASFDHAVCTLTLCTVANPTAALSEVARVLRPNGRLHLIEHVRGEGALGRAQDAVRPLWQALAAGCIANRRTDLLLAACGFAVERRWTVRAALGIPILVATARPR